jgi:hypothetical protein
LAAKQYLIVGDAISPLVAGDSPTALSGISRALAVGDAKVTVVTLGAPEVVSAIPGLARRLTTFQALKDSAAQEVSFYEGRAVQSQANLLIASARANHRGEAAGILADAVRTLTDESLQKVDVALAWGESAAWALSLIPAASRFFVLPTGRVGGDLDDAEYSTLAAAGAFSKIGGIGGSGRGSLAALGVAYSNIIVAPSPSSARLLESDPSLASRASDEPCIAIRFGSDDPPNDAATDGALATNFSAKSPAGKGDCRRALTKRYSLTMGPRTLLLAVSPLRAGRGGEEVLRALPGLAALDVAVVVSAEGDVDILERVRRLAVQSPGRLAVMEAGETQSRTLRAAADAILCADPDDRTGRAPTLAQRYGCLPIALDFAAGADYLVDFDQASQTGTAILFDGLEPWQIEAAVRRAIGLKSSVEIFPELSRRLMEVAPLWSQAASAIDEISAQYALS